MVQVSRVQQTASKYNAGALQKQEMGNVQTWEQLDFDPLERETGGWTALPSLARQSPMSQPLTAAEVLNREFLEIRGKILELAAAFDRLGRAEGAVAGDARLDRLREALEVLQGDVQGRAEQVQLIFSREYDDHWQDNLNVKPR